jgi:EAL domain-containing protein (putative c-di-GMP-specific phosphodiesterase class I)
VAIGVQSAEQLAFLRELGCPAAQGFHISPPLDADAIRALLTRSSAGWARTA